MANNTDESLEQKLARLDRYTKQCESLDLRLKMHVQELKGLMLCIIELATELNLLRGDIAQERYEQILNSNIAADDKDEANEILVIVKDLYKHMLNSCRTMVYPDSIAKLSLTIHAPGDQSCRVHSIDITKNFDNVCITCSKCGAKIELTFDKVMK